MSESSQAGAPSGQGPWLLDADALITAWRHHYPPDVFPRLWEILGQAIRSGEVVLIASVCNEIVAPGGLHAWCQRLKSFVFDDRKSQAVLNEVHRVARWLSRETQKRKHSGQIAQSNWPKLDRAVESFGKTDIYLVGAAIHRRGTIITYEAEEPGLVVSTKRVVLPSVAAAFEVLWARPVALFRAIGARGQ